MATEPFSIDVPDQALDDLLDRLSRTRFATRSAPDWRAGTDPDYLRELIGYWRDGFDWRARERELNAIPQFTAQVGGRRIHLTHLRASAASSAALPIVLTHGWPSSFMEMLPLARLLAADGFDVVVPSLPGFLFSEPLTGPATPDAIAAAWSRLMTEVLGYERFGAYGGDIGSHVTDFLGANHASSLVGVYTHHPELHPTDLEHPPPSEAEQAYLARRAAEPDDDSAYAAVQSTRPDTLAAALGDSPAGLAAWLVEKYCAWSDCSGDLESRFDKDFLLTVITLYWTTDCIGTSFLPYFHDAQTPPLPSVTVPAGVTVTTEDGGYPREFAERTYRDLRQWHVTDRGRHFLAYEEPELLAEHLTGFFRPLRNGG